MLAGPPPGRLLDSDEPMYKFVQALPEVCCCFLGGRSPSCHCAELTSGNVAAQVLSSHSCCSGAVVTDQLLLL